MIEVQSEVKVFEKGLNVDIYRCLEVTILRRQSQMVSEIFSTQSVEFVGTL